VPPVYVVTSGALTPRVTETLLGRKLSASPKITIEEEAMALILTAPISDRR
jgi:hypothetical protein